MKNATSRSVRESEVKKQQHRFEYNMRSVALSPAGVASLGIFLDDTSAEAEDL